MTVFYDDDCGLCTRSIRVLKHLDIDEKFSYFPLTSQEAEGHDIEAGTVALVLDGKVHHRSEAVRLMLWHAGGVAMILSAGLFLIPLPVREWVYRWIVKNRYRFFGGTCVI